MLFPESTFVITFTVIVLLFSNCNKYKKIYGNKMLTSPLKRYFKPQRPKFLTSVPFIRKPLKLPRIWVHGQQRPELLTLLLSWGKVILWYGKDWSSTMCQWRTLNLLKAMASWKQKWGEFHTTEERSLLQQVASD